MNGVSLNNTAVMLCKTKPRLQSQQVSNNGEPYHAFK